MKQSDIKNAELALAITLHKSIPNQRPGRLKGLLEKLAKESEKEINRLQRPTKESLDEIKIALDNFADMTGWSKSKKHLQSYVNAILLILEKRNYTKINSILIDILDYQERKKAIHPSCFWSGEVVEKKWLECFSG